MMKNQRYDINTKELLGHGQFSKVYVGIDLHRSNDSDIIDTMRSSNQSHSHNISDSHCRYNSYSGDYCIDNSNVHKKDGSEDDPKLPLVFKVNDNSIVGLSNPISYTTINIYPFQ